MHETQAVVMRYPQGLLICLMCWPNFRKSFAAGGGIGSACTDGQAANGKRYVGTKKKQGNRMQQQKRKLISQAHPNDHAAQKKQQKKLATPQRYDFKSGALESR